MCSQPPKDKDDVASLAERNLELIRLMDPVDCRETRLLHGATGRDAIDLVLASPESALSSPASGSRCRLPKPTNSVVLSPSAGAAGRVSALSSLVSSSFETRRADISRTRTAKRR
jgi:hypothetical protein